jgi:hypothetical protein
MIESLAVIYEQFKENDFPDKGTVHSYITFYEKILQPYRNTALNILEIGILSGASLRMWEKYFTGTVWGIDCDARPVGGKYDLRPMIKEGIHNIIIMDATDPMMVHRYFRHKLLDVIIDDASHQLESQLITYNNFKHLISPGGIYIIEDIQDIDKNRLLFETLDPEKTIEIFDFRSLKKRYDDVIITIK